MSRREEIVAAARLLLERDGEPALTMRNLAGCLGMKAPSLYKHVGSRSEIETLLAAEALKEMAESLGAEPDLVAMGRAYREWARANPALYRLSTTRPLDRKRLPEGVEDAAAAPLVEAVGGDRALARAFWALAHGLTLLELDGRFPSDADVDSAWSAGLERLQPA